MLRRILLIVAILYLVWRIVAAWGQRLARTAPGADSFSRFSPFARSPRRRRGSESTSELEELVACDQCGTYVPARRALQAGDGLVFCGEACRTTHQQPAEHGGRSG